MPVGVLNHDHELAVTRGCRRLVRDARPGNACGERVAEPAVAGVDGDRRLRPQLDHDSRTRQSHLTLGSNGARSGRRADPAIWSVNRGACPAGPGDARSRFDEALL